MRTVCEKIAMQNHGTTPINVKWSVVTHQYSSEKGGDQILDLANSKWLMRLWWSHESHEYQMLNDWSKNQHRLPKWASRSGDMTKKWLHRLTETMTNSHMGIWIDTIEREIVPAGNLIQSPNVNEAFAMSEIVEICSKPDLYPESDNRSGWLACGAYLNSSMINGPMPIELSMHMIGWVIDIRQINAGTWYHRCEWGRIDRMLQYSQWITFK